MNFTDFMFLVILLNFIIIIADKLIKNLDHKIWLYRAVVWTSAFGVVLINYIKTSSIYK
jgi:hypothetical protein